MVFLLLVSVLFSRTPYLLLIDGRYRYLTLVHTEKLKPMIKGTISGRMLSSGTSHVAYASDENPSEEVLDYDNYYTARAARAG